MVKKTIILTILLLITAGSAFAAAPRVDLGSASGNPGDTVSMTVTLTNVPGTSVSAIGMDIGYDINALDNPVCSIGPAGSAAVKLCDGYIPETGIFRIGIFGFNNNVIGDGVVAYVSFTIKPAAQGGLIELSNTPSASDPAGNTIANVSGANGSITVAGSICGDMNSDGKIDISDVILVLRCALELDICNSGADMNGDGKIDISDVILVLRCALELDSCNQPCIGF